MAIKFVELLKRFFPKGKIWEFQTNFQYFLDGISIEFSKAYESAKTFYNNFNIIESSQLANEHSQDYLIIQDKYTKKELQRIIVKYLNGDIEFKAAIEDFADFINANISWTSLPLPFIFGSSKFGDAFGDKIAIGYMQLFINFDSNTDCNQYAKIVWLVNFLKPPYLEVIFSNQPLANNESFTFGSSKFGDKFKNVIPCELF